MTLQIRSLHLHDFRSYPDASLEDIGRLVVFVGPNAAGKTNLVEAIQLITALDSFRNPKTDQLIAWGAQQAAVRAVLEGDERKLDVGLVLDARGRHYRLNGKQRPRAELQGVLPAVAFTPDDLQLVKGSPEVRRAAMDALGAQVSRNYLSVRRDYEKIVRQKNRLLKEEATVSYLASVNEVLVKVGSQLFLYRLRILRGIRGLLDALHADTTGSGDAVSLEYFPSFAPDAPVGDDDLARYEHDRPLVENLMQEEISRRALEEQARHTSVIGPHRDKPAFFLNGRPAADFASQGQQRSIAIAYKLSELQLVEDMTHEKPILLLDDVMSELDASRRATLTKYVHEAAQTFVTTTNLEYFTPELLDRAQVFHVPRDVFTSE